MLTRRQFVATGLAAVAAGPSMAQAQQTYVVPEEFMPRTVRIAQDFEAGSIHVVPGAHKLYLMLGDRRAIQYTVAVGAAGLNFRGDAVIQRKAEWPSWTPTKAMIKREPNKYAKFAGGVPGGPTNPLGARALYLYRNGRDTFYRIHGTPQPWTIGTSVSSGCIRLINSHVMDLYERVPVGTGVTVHS